MTLNVCQAGHTFHESKLVDTQYGPFNIWDWEKYRGQTGIYCTGQDDVSMSLDLYGNWERPDIARMREVLTEQPGPVLDVGAHIGWYGIQAAELGCTVLAVEADPENARLLASTADEWGIGGSLSLHVEWIAGASWLPAFLPPLRFLKADVEGAEDQVIDWTRPLWQRREIDYALLEISPVFKDYYPALVDELIGYGYQTYIIKDEGDWHITGKDVVFPQENVWLSKN